MLKKLKKRIKSVKSGKLGDDVSRETREFL